MTIRMPDRGVAHDLLSARGAHFLTPPHHRVGEIRCSFRHPTGHLFEISQAG